MSVSLEPFGFEDTLDGIRLQTKNVKECMRRIESLEVHSGQAEALNLPVQLESLKSDHNNLKNHLSAIAQRVDEVVDQHAADRSSSTDLSALQKQLDKVSENLAISEERGIKLESSFNDLNKQQEKIQTLESDMRKLSDKVQSGDDDHLFDLRLTDALERKQTFSQANTTIQALSARVQALERYHLDRNTKLKEVMRRLSHLEIDNLSGQMGDISVATISDVSRAIQRLEAKTTKDILPKLSELEQGVTAFMHQYAPKEELLSISEQCRQLWDTLNLCVLKSTFEKERDRLTTLLNKREELQFLGLCGKTEQLEKRLNDYIPRSAIEDTKRDMITATLSGRLEECATAAGLSELRMYVETILSACVLGSSLDREIKTLGYATKIDIANADEALKAEILSEGYVTSKTLTESLRDNEKVLTLDMDDKIKESFASLPQETSTDALRKSFDDLHKRVGEVERTIKQDDLRERLVEVASRLGHGGLESIQTQLQATSSELSQLNRAFQETLVRKESVASTAPTTRANKRLRSSLDAEPDDGRLTSSPSPGLGLSVRSSEITSPGIQPPDTTSPRARSNITVPRSTQINAVPATHSISEPGIIFDSTNAAPADVLREAEEIQSMHYRANARRLGDCLYTRSTQFKKPIWSFTGGNMNACKMCTNSERPCLLIVHGGLEILPLTSEVRTGNANDRAYWIRQKTTPRDFSPKKLWNMGDE